MSTTTRAAEATGIDAQAVIDRGLDLLQRHLALAFEDPDGVLGPPSVPPITVLLPIDDPEVFEDGLRTAAALAREGQNIYLCHVDGEGRPVYPAPNE